MIDGGNLRSFKFIAISLFCIFVVHIFLAKQMITFFLPRICKTRLTHTPSPPPLPPPHLPVSFALATILLLAIHVTNVEESYLASSVNFHIGIYTFNAWYFLWSYLSFLVFGSCKHSFSLCILTIFGRLLVRHVTLHLRVSFFLKWPGWSKVL